MNVASRSLELRDLLNPNAAYIVFVCYEYSSFPRRTRPDKGMLIKDHQLTLVFVTICTKGRKPWLATDDPDGGYLL